MKQSKINLNSGVYQIRVKNNKILYVGASKNLGSRFNQHYNSLKNNSHENIFLQEICNNIGFDNLEFNIINFCNEDEIFINEQMFIKILNPIYNISNNKIEIVSFIKSEENLIDKYNLDYNIKIYNNNLKTDNIKSTLKELEKYCTINNICFKKYRDSIGRYFVISKLIN